MSTPSEIADLIYRQGQIAGQGAQNLGAIWGGALGQAGQTIAALPTYVQNQRMREQEVQMRQQEMGIRQQQSDQLQRAQASQDAASRIVAGFPRRADGTYDVGGLVQQMSGAGVHPSDVEHFGSTIEKINQLSTTAVQAQREHQARAADIILSGAQGKEITPEDVHVALATLKTLPGGLVTDDDEQAWTDAFAKGADPRAFLESVSKAGHAPEKPITLKSDERLLTPEGKVIVPSEPKVGEGQHVINGQLVGPDGQPIGAQIPPQVTPAELETQRHNKALEDAQRLQYGRETAVQTETARHNRAMEDIDQSRVKASQAGVNPTDMSAVPDVAPGQKNEDFLKTLAPPVASQVKALAEGRMSFPTGQALRSDYWQNLLQAVGKYDPSFDAVNYQARAKTRADFTSGKAAGQVNAINTVIGHLSGLSDAAESLNNGNIPAFNSIANTISKATGSPKVTNFDTIKKAVSDEVTRVWRQSGGSEADIQAAQKNLDASGSPAQLRGAIATYADLLESKLTSLNEQYRQGMGTDKIDMITPAAQKALDAIKTRAGRTPASTGGVSVTAPNGQVYTFPTADAAAAFKARAGIK